MTDSPTDSPSAPGRDDVIEQWYVDLCAHLGVDPEHVTPAEVLDLAAVAAHAVIRPAAPLTTFLVGYAAGLAGGGQAAVRTAARSAAELAEERR